ncbi:CHAT domain-containing protein, partial [Mycena leptocephala]
DDPSDMMSLAGSIVARFHQNVALSDLSTAIMLYQEALLARQSSGPENPRIIRQLANAHLIRFRFTGDIQEQQESLSLLRRLHIEHPNQVSCLCAALLAKPDTTTMLEAVDLIEEASKSDNEALQLAQTGVDFLQVFRQSGNGLDIDMAVSTLKRADIQLSWGHSKQATLKDSLASAYHERFKARVDSADLDSTIELHFEMLGLESEDGQDCSDSRHSLATLLYERFERRGEQSDLDAAITLLNEAVRLRPAPHPNRGTSLTNLAGALTVRFQTRGEPADLDQAIILYHEALEFVPALHPTRGSCLNNFAVTLHQRFEMRGDPVDLDGAVDMYHKALELVPVPHPQRGPAMTNLGNVLCTRFGMRGQPADIDEAIGLYRNALELLPASHPHHSSTLYNLANALYDRFRMSGDLAELDSAIGLQHKVLDLRPAPHPKRGSSLNSLANLIQERYATGGDPEDLDTPIRLLREAVDLNPPPHPYRGTSLNSLANALTSRFEIKGDLADLDSAIDLRREALIQQPDFHARSSWLNNLASGLSQRFHMRAEPTDLDSVIELQREVLKLRPVPHPGRGDSLSNLASALSDRFETRGEPKDLDSAIDLYHEALDLQPAAHPDRGVSLNGLGNVYRQKFQKWGKLADIEYAVKLYREALDILPPSHIHYGLSLSNTALGLMEIYNKTLESYHMEEAIVTYRRAASHMSSSVSHRCKMSATWARDADERNHASALEAYETAIELLPQLAALGLNIDSRQRAMRLESNIGLAMDAASCASRLNEMGKAVQFLEAGRSVFWSQALQLHVPLDDLRAAHPELAKRIAHMVKEFEHGSHREVTSSPMLSHHHEEHMAIDAEDRHYREINSDWVQALRDVRELPGFEGFLQPKPLEELKEAARHGPVIILNASRSCTAFVLSLSEDVQLMQDISTREASSTSTELPDLQNRLLAKRENPDHYSADEALKDILEALWTLIVQPIFRALGWKKTQKPGRLWWCPTGAFSFLPIHAAGIYDGGIEADCVSDYVVSSYTPTLSSLLNPPTETAASFKMTALIQPNTPECLPLPGTEEELTRIEGQVPQQWLNSLGRTSQATVEAALVHLRESSIVHFACHGIQDRKKPLDSGLLLTDGRLKVSDLMRTNDDVKSQKTMTLAFLSACETAKGDDKVPDEAMHLAATLLFAGFRGVVATMWTIADPDGPKIADTFYAHLFKACNINAEPPVPPDLTDAAEALHVAVAKLRADPNVSFKRWVPFVHYGL